ncbi:MAG: diguanylate cyclase [candidate division NC10 bacterium]|nr:diguanylate cyclase [candidate division NC10 bacterium]
MPECWEGGSKTVLIVEDDANGIRRLCELLTHRGFAVLQASSKEEALDILATGRAELVVLDVGSYVALQQRADRLAAINRLTRVIGTSFDLGKIYQTFAAEVGRLIHYDWIGLALQDTSGHGLKVLPLATDQTITGKSESVCVREEGTGIKWVMRQRHPHIERDLAESKQFVEDEALLKAGIRSFVRLPLIVNGKAIGVLCLDSATPHCYGEREVALLVPLSEQLAIAIETGRLFQEVHRLAITDELTGLFNHRHFYGQLEQEMRRTRRYGHPLSLIMLDLDLFKKYNDLNGHLAGDEALRLIADRLKNSTRDTDIVARYGGDEFGIILPETDLRQAWVQAERIRSVMERDPLGGQGAPDGNRLTVSLGVACLEADMHKVEDLVRVADQALYCAKAAGGNQTSVSESCDRPRPSTDAGQGRCGLQDPEVG